MTQHRFLSGLAALLLAAPAVPAFADDSGPPYLRALAVQRGVSVPRPYGLSVVYSNTSQDLQLQDFVLSGPDGNRQSVDFVGLQDSKLKSSTVLLKGDIWLFPFLNLYAFAGQANNKLTADVTIPVDQAAAYAGSTACADPDDRPQACNATLSRRIDRDTDALNYGVGANLAVARGDAFAMLGLVYATNDADKLDTKVDVINVSPRVGWLFHPNQQSRVAVYAGATFLDSTVDLDNQITVDIPGQGPTSIDYSVSQKNDHDWSYLGGFNWDITREWSLQAEYAVGAREGLLSSLTWRFGGS